MIVVTGGAGFIGSNLINELNTRGFQDILIVEDKENLSQEKLNNIKDLLFLDVIDKDNFINKVDKFNIETIFHQGACSDTTEANFDYIMDNNYHYSKKLLDKCVNLKIPFIYASSASVYGDGSNGFSENILCENPLNYYAYSKKTFDDYARTYLSKSSKIIGLRYFNVFGPREKHKNYMASIIYKLFIEIRENKTISLFKGIGKYANGEQKRDFIYVQDILNINMAFFNNNFRNGIYNCGTGRAHTFNEVANILIERYGGEINYIPIPNNLQNKYQSYTEANVDLLNLALGDGYHFQDIRSSINEYCDYLEIIEKKEIILHG